MKHIDVKNLIESAGLTVDYAAKKLFPGNKYPGVAMNRVLLGQTELDASQIAALAEILNVDYNHIFRPFWHGSMPRPGIYVFVKGNCRAVLDVEANRTNIYVGDNNIADYIHKGSLVVKDYLKNIDTLIESNN